MHKRSARRSPSSSMVRAPPAGHTGHPTPPVHATREVVEVVEIGSELRRVDTPAPRASSPATMRQTAAHLATSRAPDEVLPAEARAREEARVQVLQAKLSLTADRLDTGADWCALVLSQAEKEFAPTCVFCVLTIPRWQARICTMGSPVPEPRSCSLAHKGALVPVSSLCRLSLYLYGFRGNDRRQTLCAQRPIVTRVRSHEAREAWPQACP